MVTVEKMEKLLKEIMNSLSKVKIIFFVRCLLLVQENEESLYKKRLFISVDYPVLFIYLFIYLNLNLKIYNFLFIYLFQFPNRVSDILFVHPSVLLPLIGTNFVYAGT